MPNHMTTTNCEMSVNDSKAEGLSFASQVVAQFRLEVMIMLQYLFLGEIR